MTSGYIHGVSGAESRRRLQDFAHSVGQHYLRCLPWRNWVDTNVVERVTDCYILHGKRADYGFFFCPWCSTQVALLKAHALHLQEAFVEGVEDAID